MDTQTSVDEKKSQQNPPEEQDPSDALSLNLKQAESEEESDKKIKKKKPSGDDPDDDDDDDSDDDDSDDDDDGETGTTSGGEEDENELIQIKKEDPNTKNPFFKPENVRPKIQQKEQIKGPQKTERSPWQQMMDFLLHGAQGAMIKNGDISIKERIADKFLVGLGFKSFKEDILLQEQAQKYWKQKLSGQKADLSLLNTDHIIRQLKKEVKQEIYKEQQKEPKHKAEKSRFLSRLFFPKQKEDKQPVQKEIKNVQQKPLQTFNQSSQNMSKSEEKPIPSSRGLKEKIGEAVQFSNQKQDNRIPHQPMQHQYTENPKIVAETQQKQSEKNASSPITEQQFEKGKEKEQKQNQKEFQNMALIQQMQMQASLQNQMQIQTTLQNQMQIQMQQQHQNLQQQMNILSAIRPHHHLPPFKDLIQHKPTLPGNQTQIETPQSEEALKSGEQKIQDCAVDMVQKNMALKKAQHAYGGERVPEEHEEVTQILPQTQHTH